MPTSELSDALNPYYAQPRFRPTHVSGAQRPQTALQSTGVHHTSHRSELELAVSKPPVTPPSPQIGHGSTRSTSSQSGGVHAVQELLRFLASTREAQEIERKRRIAWEQEQEAKYRLRQAEMEGRMLEMQQEITALKARVAFSTPGSSSVIAHGNSVLLQHPQLEYGSLVSSSQQPTPSTSPTLSHPSTPGTLSQAVGQALGVTSTDGVFDSGEPSIPTSYLASPLLPGARFVNLNLRGRSGERTGSEEESNTDVTAQQRVRRKSHHDRRCLTIQHAMRNHLLRVMMLDTDKELPDSHMEGTGLGPDEPVRFVWDKTPRQSVHNGRMKERVLKDLKANRKLYKHVADREFGKKMLDSAFDQAFVTLRQKFRAQRDESAARAHKQREEVKAQRARRVSRRKVKLGNRSEARNKMGMFEDVMFDGALQLECMSSEESSEEEDERSGTRTTVLRIRGMPWRSARLRRFYDALDESDRAENAQRPRRGVGRKERVAGPAKEGVVIPPKGVARWMISKGWLRTMEERHGEVIGMLKEIVEEGDIGAVLGEESDSHGGQ